MFVSDNPPEKQPISSCKYHNHIIQTLPHTTCIQVTQKSIANINLISRNMVTIGTYILGLRQYTSVSRLSIYTKLKVLIAGLLTHTQTIPSYLIRLSNISLFFWTAQSSVLYQIFIISHRKTTEISRIWQNPRVIQLDKVKKKQVEVKLFHTAVVLCEFIFNFGKSTLRVPPLSRNIF